MQHLSKSALGKFDFTGIKFREFREFWPILRELLPAKITKKLSIRKIRKV